VHQNVTVILNEVPIQKTINSFFHNLAKLLYQIVMDTLSGIIFYPAIPT